ncbi:MAG: deoxyribose-phosphate aldolase [Schwartzia sp.]|jgi:deoxyribose-phosphate aldolase|nr:deoxyribose-phosphate aldolase [Schwartzia sp. (in: firmicutes)]MBQ2047824.1 deoxyribose-phosphate aldolase [Schwartzia sp. (in: firmicutes)]MBQ3864149.1 deoxyribose-phosphate aldolase [Schwartzia sp. (in: firmicutes)]MCR5447640.1 deoxyribose-phosphate aldolase [Schwartzia sp. (in: firmicutes)]
MKGSDILKHVDHTLLSPTATWPQIEELCEEALIYHTASICIPPSYVSRVHETFGASINICTVIGFPLGADTTEAKVWAAKQAVKNGASEIDAVVNLGDVKNGDFDKITEEIAALKKAVGKHILKIIIETCYLEDEEKIALCHAVTDGGADYIKTSTGFGSAGASHADVVLMRANVGKDVKVKAAGGIRTISDMKQYLSEGCDRLGCSAAVRLLKDKTDIEV